MRALHTANPHQPRRVTHWIVLLLALPLCFQARAEFGVMTHFAQGWDPALIPLMQSDGVSHVRDELYWAEVEKERGIYQFPPRYREYMDALKEAGIKVLVPLTFANPLYDRGLTPYTEEGFAAYARYCVAVLDEFGDQISAVEIWNEYNGSFCEGPAAENRAETYAKMLAHAAKAIRAKHPNVSIIGGVTAAVPLPYFEKLFATGALAHMDAVSVHPYRFDAPPEGIEDVIAQFDALIRQHNNGEPKPIWVSEIGWATKSGGFQITEQDQADFLVRSFALLRSAGVENIYWYLLRDYDQFATMGLRRNDTTFTAKPAMGAFIEADRWMAGAKFLHREPSRDDIYSLLFADVTGEFRVLWALEPIQLGKLNLTTSPIFTRDPTGPLPPAEVRGEILADSRRDFSGEQTAKGWSYGSLRDGKFTPCPTFKVTDWTREWTGPDWLAISDTAQHPAPAAEAVRRWTSTHSGPARITATFRAGSQGDGIIARVLVSGKELASAHLGGSDPVAKTFDLPATLEPGTTVDFAVSAGSVGNIEFDSTSVAAVIRAAHALPPGSARASRAGFGALAETPNPTRSVISKTLGQATSNSISGFAVSLDLSAMAPKAVREGAGATQNPHTRIQ